MTPSQGTDELTRKQRREQARAERKALEEARRSRSARRKRLTQLGGVLAVAVVLVVVVAVVAGGGGSNKATSTKGPVATKTSRAVSSELSGIPQTGNALGTPTAPVTMLYYADLQCPVCRDFTLGALPQVITGYVRPNKLRIEFHALQTATPDPTTFQDQQVAALAAGKQNRLWHYVELFYNEQGQEGTGYVTEAYLSDLANQIPGLNLSQWKSDRNNPALAQQVSTDTGVSAPQLGLNATPSLVLKGPRGSKTLVGAATFGDVRSAIKAVS